MKKFAHIFLFIVLCAAAVSSRPETGLSDFEYLTGLASWYAEFSPGVRPTTANMEIFDDEKLTCAMWNVPFDTVLEVTNLENGKCVLVRVNDRGPARRFCAQGRVVDLTQRAFSEIADLETGLAYVRVKRVK